MKNKKPSPRQKLAAIACGGDLRYWLEKHMDDETLQLLVDVAIRYCEPRRTRRRQ